jgi:uncharacterized protein YdeI (YjbR/CyaY-like superfamily)
MKPTFFRSASDFHRWLDAHHDSSSELLVGFYKKELGRGITYPEALDAALCFGWIDGVRKRFDEQSYTIRFTPRKPHSIWSVVNIKRAQELVAEGRVRPPGLRAFQGRDEEKTKKYSYEREQAAFDSALEAKLRANRKASSFFDTQPPGYRKLATFWVMSAKKEETRAKRMDQLIACSASGKRIDQLKPYGK